MPTFASIVRARALALLEKHEQTATGVARAMGKAHTWLLRKLQDGPQSRGLGVDDLDALLVHLGEPPSALLLPVLLPGDREVLQACACSDSTRPSVEQLRTVFPRADEHLARLHSQGLIDDNNKTIPQTGLTY